VQSEEPGRAQQHESDKPPNLFAGTPRLRTKPQAPAVDVHPIPGYEVSFVRDPRRFVEGSLIEEVEQVPRLPTARVRRDRASRVESAPQWRIDRVGHLPLGEGLEPAAVRVGDRDRAEEGLRVRVPGLAEDFLRIPD